MSILESIFNGQTRDEVCPPRLLAIPFYSIDRSKKTLGLSIIQTAIRQHFLGEQKAFPDLHFIDDHELGISYGQIDLRGRGDEFWKQYDAALGYIGKGLHRYWDDLPEDEKQIETFPDVGRVVITGNPEYDEIARSLQQVIVSLKISANPVSAFFDLYEEWTEDDMADDGNPLAVTMGEYFYKHESETLSYYETELLQGRYKPLYEHTDDPRAMAIAHVTFVFDQVTRFGLKRDADIGFCREFPYADLLAVKDWLENEAELYVTTSHVAEQEEAKAKQKADTRPAPDLKDPVFMALMSRLTSPS